MILNVNTISCAIVCSITVGSESTAMTSHFWLYWIAAFVWQSIAHLRVKHSPVCCERMLQCSQISWDSSRLSVSSAYVKNSVWVEKMCLTGRATSHSVFNLCVWVCDRERLIDSRQLSDRYIYAYNKWYFFYSRFFYNMKQNVWIQFSACGV